MFTETADQDRSSITKQNSFSGIVCFCPYRITADAAIGITLSLVVKSELVVNNVDIIAAYLNGFLDDDDFMEQPPLYEDLNNLGEVCKPNKPLYGLRQAGHNGTVKKL
ncbi:hypothetical protein GQX74_005780 [Glossina fuscipes]|nr:hypothetical protein GQX74_005780 [Glossina fuscipes]